jgi:hypothetical protein
MIKPIVHYIIAIYCINKPAPLMAGKSDKKHSGFMWDGSFLQALYKDK